MDLVPGDFPPPSFAEDCGTVAGPVKGKPFWRMLRSSGTDRTAFPMPWRLQAKETRMDGYIQGIRNIQLNVRFTGSELIRAKPKTAVSPCHADRSKGLLNGVSLWRRNNKIHKSAGLRREILAKALKEPFPDQKIFCLLQSICQGFAIKFVPVYYLVV